MGTNFLRLVLKLDAIASGAVGAGLLALSPFADDLFGMPPALAVPAGVFLLPYAGWVWYTATRAQISTVAVWAIVILNLLWVLDSALLAAGSSSLTALGTAFILAQATAVLGFAAFQYAGLRRLRTATR
ncbi:hypothetical protein K1W54_40965 [Micromonospora sp. CPCC 205371]|nr:hypothetical protein [Micromonospora sp. CPCC 205371]